MRAGRWPDAPRRELIGWAGVALAILGALSVGVGLGAVGRLAGTAYVVLVWTLLARGLRRAGARALGPANRVTAARSTLVAAVTALVADRSGAVGVLVGLAVVALLLDGVDGRVARRTGTVSALGARFDMEIDASLILVLSVLVAEVLGPWVLAIGAMRYAYVLAARPLRWLRALPPFSMARKVVAVLQAVALLVAASGLLARPVSLAVVSLALALLTWSFGRDVGYLYRHRHPDREGDAGP